MRNNLVWPVAVLFVCPAILAQTATWLQPPDAVMTRAIDDGFSAKKLPKDALYHKIVNPLKQAIGSQIQVVPPLFCALQEGQVAHDKLEPKPTLDSVKATCLNRVIVTMIHYSQALNANWPCIFEKGDVTLQPDVKLPDQNPPVLSYYPGGAFSADKVVGYGYTDVYSFSIPGDWLTSATLTYADESGKHGSLTIDFSVFAKDVASHQ